jgi:hypothetical protein
VPFDDGREIIFPHNVAAHPSSAARGKIPLRIEVSEKNIRRDPRTANAATSTRAVEGLLRLAAQIARYAQAVSIAAIKAGAPRRRTAIIPQKSERKKARYR